VLARIGPSPSRLVFPLQQNTFAISDMSLAPHPVSLHILISFHGWMI
jgi:hypothetical protein